MTTSNFADLIDPGGSVRAGELPHLDLRARAPRKLVVQAPEGGPVRATNFQLHIYNPAIERAGLDGLTFHRLRHSAGHLMGELGVPLDIIQRRLGHASIRTTPDIYGSLPTKVDRAVAAELDGLFGPENGPDVVDDHGLDLSP